jgi:hypothetical protein
MKTLGWRVRHPTEPGTFLHRLNFGFIYRFGRGELFTTRNKALAASILRIGSGVLVRIVAKAPKYVIRKRNPRVYNSFAEAVNQAAGFDGGLVEWKVVRARAA